MAVLELRPALREHLEHLERYLTVSPWPVCDPCARQMRWHEDEHVWRCGECKDAFDPSYRYGRGWSDG